MVTSNPTEIRIASVFRDENGIIIITMKECGEVDEFDVVDLNLVIRHKAQNQAALKLLVATVNWNMTKKARAMSENEDNISRTRARAIVVSNSVKVSFMNFLKSFNDKEYPQQFFIDKEAAYSWLLTFKEGMARDLLF
jgi:hypothetical protein